jgi:serine/threonine-protein kinase RsbW
MAVRESVPGKLTCTVQGGDAVGVASQLARAFGEAEWLSEDELARLCIIVEELVANLYDHGGLSETHEVELSLESEPGGIRIVIIDPAAPFDPRSAPSTGRQADRVGGAGIDIVRAWAEFVTYSTSAEHNRLELLLPVGSRG